MRSNFILLIMSVMLISLVSANGLNIQNNIISINKTNGVDFNFNFTISNQENFKIFNITSKNSIITFDKFDLDSGQNKTISAKIVSNSDFIGDIKIAGDYYAEIGLSNETQEVVISSTGVDVCNLNLIQGDTIKWINTFSGSVSLRNMDTLQYFSTIVGYSNYSLPLSESMQLNYQVYKIGLPYSEVCNINVIGESGYVHSSVYDANLNLSLNILYDETILEAVFLTDSYNLSYNSNQEDILKITNTGGEIAKNIHLSGEWFSFDSNDFDLSAGASRNIGYTISPEIYETENTNKTYNKKVSITGNFETIEKDISIFIKYKDISGIFSNETYDYDLLKSIKLLFCEKFPEDCQSTYSNGTGVNGNTSIIVDNEVYKEALLEEDAFREEIRMVLSNLNNRVVGLDEKTSSIENETTNTISQLKKSEEKSEEFLSILGLLGVIFLVLMAVGGILFILYKNKSKIKSNPFFGGNEVRP